MQPPSLVNQNSDQYFAPKGKYLWDSWFLNTVEGVHAFYLCSSRDGDPEGRHHNSVSIGHAFSSDLYSWTDLGLSLEPSSDDTRFDSLSLWTGDIFEHEKKGGRPHHVLRHILGLYQRQPGGKQFRRELSVRMHGPNANADVLNSAVAVTQRPQPIRQTA